MSREREFGNGPNMSKLDLEFARQDAEEVASIARRTRSEKLTVRLLPGTVHWIQRRADAEGETVAEWIERMVEKDEIESEMRGTVGKRSGER